MVQIFSIVGYLSHKTNGIIVKTIEAEETNKTYKFHNGYSTKFLNKKRLLEVDSMSRNVLWGNERDMLSFFTYCKKKDIPKARKLVQEALKQRVNELVVSMEKLKTKYTHPISEQIIEEDAKV